MGNPLDDLRALSAPRGWHPGVVTEAAAGPRRTVNLAALELAIKRAGYSSPAAAMLALLGARPDGFWRRLQEGIPLAPTGRALLARGLGVAEAELFPRAEASL